MRDTDRGCILFHQSDRPARSEQKFAVLFHRSEQSDQNVPRSFSVIRSLTDFGQNKATECLDTPPPLSFVYIFTADCNMADNSWIFINIGVL